MPRLRSPPVQRPPSGAGGDADDDDDDDDEGEYGAESFDSPTPSLKGALGSSGNKPPSEKKKNVGFAGMAADGGDDDDDVADGGGGGDDSDNKQEALALGQSASKVSLAASESGKSLVEGMDLETFMKNASRKRDEDSSAPSNTNDPSMRPLEGVSPTKTSADLALGLKLGYEELEEEGKSADRFKRQLVQAAADDDDDDDDEEERLSSFMNRQTSKMPPPQRPKQLGGLKKQSDETAADSKGPITPAQYAYYASLLNRKVDVAALDGQPLRSVTDEDSARRVDALLNELIPSRAVKAQPHVKPKSNKIVPQQHEPQQRKTKPVGGASAAAAAAASASSMMGPDGGRNQQYGLGAIGSKRSLGDSDDYPGGEVVGDSRYQQSLESQIATLKKDMRARDDRLSRLTEHSMMLSNHCDNLKAELAQMQQKLRSAELELDAKEQRASDAARLRKKAQKKSAKLAAEMENYDALVQTCERLQNREQALLEAVEALSTQNEDLIKKLKASMSRELELSQKQAKLAQVNYDEPVSPRSPPRAQSDTRLQRHKQGGARAGRLPDLGGGVGRR